MSRFAIAAKAARDYRVVALSLLLVMIAIAVMDIAIYPSYRDSLEDFEIPDYMKGFMGEAGSITTPEGFLTVEFFSWISLMLIVFAIFAGTGTTAGEESAGTLEFLLAQPVSRTRILLEKTAGLAALIALTAVLTLPAFVFTRLFVDFDVSNVRILEGLVNFIPLTWLFLALAVAAGVTLPSRGSALTVVLGALIVWYFLYSLGAAVPALEESRKFTPLYWADNSRVLVHGTDWLRHAAFLAVAGVVLAAAVVAFNRRDIATSQGFQLPMWRRPPGTGATPPRDVPSVPLADHD